MNIVLPTDSTSHMLTTWLHQKRCPYQYDGISIGHKENTPPTPKSTTELRSDRAQWHILFPAEVNSLIKTSKEPEKDTYLTILQQWEGVVTDITETTFWASLIDLTDPSHPEEFVELSLDEISSDDKEILVVGSIFYWAIGRAWSPGGQVRRFSEIRLQRTPRWSEDTLSTLHEKALSYMKDLNVNPDNISTDL